MGADLSTAANAESSDEFLKAVLGAAYDPNTSLGQDFDPSTLLPPQLKSATTEDLKELRDLAARHSQKLRAQIKAHSANNNAGFIETFTSIRDGLGSAATASRSDANQHLNRYSNIVAYDATRVLVPKNKENFNCDYVNANWIPSEGPRKYIAAQGPVPASLVSFWQMVVEHDARLIVMLTNEIEGGKLKCHRYWPDDNMAKPVKKVKIGTYIVSFEGEESFPTYVHRKFKLYLESGEARDVSQMAYTAWPDHGVPATTKELLGFRLAVKDQLKRLNCTPLIHCSAGVGRTGTFIGLDRYIDRVLSKRDADVLDIVRDMRRARNFMVQSQIQFVYLFLVCLDAMDQLEKLLDKYLALATKSEEEQQEEELAALTQELVATEDEAVATIKRKAKEARGSAADVFAAGPVQKDTAPPAQAPTIAERKASVQAAKPATDTGGATQAASVIGRVPSVEVRLKALSESQAAWTKNYDALQLEWEQNRESGQNAYSLDATLSPLESRIQSLANAEEAWRLRGNTTSVKEEDIRRHVASLSTRLQSLATSIAANDERWQAKGHGFRGSEAEYEDTRRDTMGIVGGLMDRVTMLSQQGEAWLHRGNVSSYKGTESFEAEVKRQRKLQEEEMQRKARDAEAQQQRQEAEARARESERRRAEEAAQQKAEEERRQRSRQNIVTQAKIASNSSSQGYDPVRVRQEKEAAQRRAQEEERQRQAQIEAEQAAIKAQEAAKSNQKDKANKKAAKFLSKLKN